ncbi:hypothetical protein P43SY_005663 [Pythium insidiosum]|uniref:Origin recognition complex subunit 2 n=1 Tax=Pythium insidiosum TaxID=114742 RepID=A0AAD5Q7T6_PYTIN|nr:hypothetical protein P43SY_005663 [Pythium insidiosum]
MDEAPMDRRSGSGLRARVLDEQHREKDTVVLGAAQATAYFNARRLRMTTKKADTDSGGTGKRKRKKQENDAPNSDAESAQRRADKARSEAEKERQQLMQDMLRRPVTDVLSILRQVDAREQSWREDSEHSWPSFEQHFPDWMSQLTSGFSLLLYGVGSKFLLLQSFTEFLPDTAYVVQVFGYMPKFSLKEIVSVLQDELPPEPPGKSLLQKCRAIVEHSFEMQQRRTLPTVFLVVHSLDGPALRDNDVQSCLARLAMAPSIHLIASIDSVNAPALWSESQGQRFRWICHDTNTMRPYEREIDLRWTREGRAAQQSISGVRYVLQSFTPTDLATLQTIARHQLASVDTPVNATMMTTTSRSARSSSKTRSMKNSVKCLEDNGLLKVVRVKQVEKLVIPLSDDVLRKDVLLEEDVASKKG